MPYPTLHLHLLRLSSNNAKSLKSGSAPTKSLAEDSLPFDLAFEEAVERLAAKENLYVEMDGSFVWNSPSAPATYWQMDGMIYDRMVVGDSGSESRIHWCDIKGAFPIEIWNEFVSCACNSRAGLHVYLPSNGQVLSLDETSVLWKQDG